MYTVQVPYKNYKKQTRTKEFTFQLETRDVIKNVVQLNSVYNWRDSLKGQDRKLSDEEMVEFFDNFEWIILAAYGEISEDGEEFDRTNRYKFEQSKAFAALMDMFVSDIPEVNKMLEQIMPEGMEDLVRKQAASLEKMKNDLPEGTDPKTRADIQAQIEALQKQIDEQ